MCFINIGGAVVGRTAITLGITMKNFDELGFLTTVGREFSNALRHVHGISSKDEHSNQDCYSVITEFLGKQVNPCEFQQLDEESLVGLAKAFNEYFEVSGVTPDDMRSATNSVLQHWEKQ